MKAHWRTSWQATDIVVYRDEQEVDRIPADRIRRVIFVHRGAGASPGDLVYALVETDEDFVIFPDHTGFAGRVNFERQVLWTEKACVYWVAEGRAGLPLQLRLRRSRWLFRSPGLQFLRVPHADLADLVDRWPLQGPQTWEQRKWRRIEDNRPFASTGPGRLRA